MSRATQVPPGAGHRISRKGLSPAMARLSSLFRYPAAHPLCRRSYNPARCLDTRGLGSCAFARHYLRNHSYFLFLRVLRCFSSPRSPRISEDAVTGSLRPGSPIRTSADQRAFAPPRGFSQLVTSFFASESHRHPPCALACFLMSFAFIGVSFPLCEGGAPLTLLLQVRSILVYHAPQTPLQYAACGTQ